MGPGDITCQSQWSWATACGGEGDVHGSGLNGGPKEVVHVLIPRICEKGLCNVIEGLKGVPG